MTRSTICSLTLLLLASACGSPETGTDEVEDTDASDTAETQDTASDTDTAGASTATLFGTIDRSTDPSAGGIGHLYVVVMDDNPMTGGGNAMGAVIVENTDFSGSGASYSYRIEGIPTSGTELYVTAFLDDNGNASQAEPGPDQGDLVAMNGISFPTVVLDTAREEELDLTLSLALPF